MALETFSLRSEITGGAVTQANPSSLSVEAEPIPTVSVIMASYNCAAYIADALRSALEQNEVAVEVIVSDDLSTDDTVAVVRDMMKNDTRIRLIEAETNGGPGRARNRAFEIARGQWLAILDSDDLFHPERLKRLVAAAERDGADIVADDLLIFEEDGSRTARALLFGKWASSTFEVDAELWINSNCLYTRSYPVLGYLKPVFRRSLFAGGRQRYNEDMRIAEDYDLVLRLLADGAKFLVYPELGYFYRKRSSSISFRMSESTVEAMRRGNERFLNDFNQLPDNVINALRQRLKSVEKALAFDQLISALKRRSPKGAWQAVIKSPSALLLLRLPILARFKRLLPDMRRESVAQDGKNLTVVSRQRVVGRTNGSSIYLLSIAGYLRQAGYRLHYVCPSPSVFGSWPILKLSPELQVFDSITIRGGARIGSMFLALDPRIGLRAVLRMVEILALKLGILASPLVGPAPYSIAQPLRRADELFLANKLPARADFLLFDYCFLTPSRAFAMCPNAPSLVLMHDLFSSRAEQFEKINGQDSVASLSYDDEIALLAKADGVVAIQRHEAEVIGRSIAPSRILVAPMAVNPVREPALGENDRLLFVGSRTAPNVDGLQWFLEKIWPEVRSLRPHAVLDVAGSVGSTVSSPSPGVLIHGIVPDLAPLYSKAGVVISPLRAGSGLKVKVVEALSFGKACVVTTTTCQGIETLVEGALWVTDDPLEQAKMIADLAGDQGKRSALCASALAVARRSFSPEACYGPISEFYCRK